MNRSVQRTSPPQSNSLAVKQRIPRRGMSVTWSTKEGKTDAGLFGQVRLAQKSDLSLVCQRGLRSASSPTAHSFIFLPYHRQTTPMLNALIRAVASKAGALLLVSAVVGCRAAEPFPFPEGTLSGYVPPPQYRLWWEAVEDCAKRSGSFDAIRWYRTVDGPLIIRGNPVAGAWFRDGNRIALFVQKGPTARHEMLHALLQDGEHPAEYFLNRCGSFLDFQGTDLYQVAARDTLGAPTLREDSVLEVSVSLNRSRLHHSSYGGALLFLVRVTNHGPSGWVDNVGYLAYVENRDNLVAEVVTSAKARVFVPAGSSRVYAVDGFVSNPDSIRVQAGFGRARSPVTVLRLPGQEGFGSGDDWR